MFEMFKNTKQTNSELTPLTVGKVHYKIHGNCS